MNERDIKIPDYFRTFIENYFDDSGRRWLRKLPSVVSRYAEAWDLDVLPPFDGLTFNYVVPVRRRDGSDAVLKVGVPEAEQRAEIFALRAFAGCGIVQLYEFNVDDQVSLIARLKPGTALSTLFPQRDDEATAIAASIMKDLAIPAPADQTEFSTVEEWATRGMEDLRLRFEGDTGPFPPDLVERAESLFHDLLASTDQQWLIHGDLHHMNILSSKAHGGWLAIDPKGVIGDRAYEPAPFILNPYDDIYSVMDVRKIFERRIDQFSEILDIERERIHGWVLAFSVLSAWWDYGSGDSWRRTIGLGEVLASIKP